VADDPEGRADSSRLDLLTGFSSILLHHLRTATVWRLACRGLSTLALEFSILSSWLVCQKKREGNSLRGNV